MREPAPESVNVVCGCFTTMLPHPWVLIHRCSGRRASDHRGVCEPQLNMSYWTYAIVRLQADKPIVWLKGEVKSPPFSGAARLEAGLLLRRLQRGDAVGMPHSRPMPSVGAQCHELRIPDREQSWRIVYHVADGAIAILEVFSKKTRSTPAQTVLVCQKRLAAFLRATADREHP